MRVVVAEGVVLAAVELVGGFVSLLSSSKSLNDLTMGSFLCMSSGRGRIDSLLISLYYLISFKYNPKMCIKTTK